MRFSLVDNGLRWCQPQFVRLKTCLIVAVTIAIGTNGPGFIRSVVAEEPCEAFLTALREERLFDVAIEYLDDMEASPLASQDFRDRIPLHKVAVLLDEAGLTRDATRLTEKLKQTQQILDEFIAAQPSATLLAEAQEQRARIFMVSAARMLTQAESDRITVQNKTKLQEDARNYLEQAGQAYNDIRERLRVELEKKLDPQNPNAGAERKALRNKYVAVRMQAPKIMEQIADSYGPEHPRYKELLTTAAEENVEMYKKYSKWQSGIDGCLGAARCLNKLGDTSRALGYLADVFDLPRGPVQLAKKREAALIAIEVWEKTEPYPLEEVFAKIRMVVYSLPTDYARTPNGVKIRMVYATTCKAMSDKIAANGGPTDAETRKRMVSLEKEATRVMRGLSQTPGPHRKESQLLLSEWGNSVSMTDEPEKGPPETLTDARDRSKNLQLRVSQFKADLAARQTLLARTSDPTKKAELQTQIDELKKRIDADTVSTLEMLEMALSFTNGQTAEDDLSNIRYLQCASYYQVNQYFESAIIGEFLLEHFPTSSGTQPAAGLVCKSYWNMYREAGEEPVDGVAADRSFEREQLAKHSTHIFKTWPGSRQAEQAGLLMTLLSLSEGDPVAADKYLEEIPEDSPTRASVVLEVGNRLWQSYTRGKRNGTMSESDLLATREQARKLLENGVAYLRVDDLSDYGARMSLSLTELYLDASLNDLAIEQLETAIIAPLDLVKSKNDAASDSRFRRDTYKTALRAYLAKLRDGEDTLMWVEKSQGVLAALKSEIGDTPEGKKELSGIYLTLARELKQQFGTLENNEQRTAFANGLESFLTALGKSADDRNLMLLTGSMLSEIGQGLRENELGEQATRFFAQAVGIYEKLAQTSEEDPRVRLAILRGRANSLRGSGEYKKAVTQFGDILIDPENRRYTDIQVDASATLAEWGLLKNDPGTLATSIQGGERRRTEAGDEVKTIMGWVELAKAAERNQDKALYARAIYNIARCKFQYGKIKKDDAFQKGAIKQVEWFRDKEPDMGGQQWKTKLEALLESMKRQRG